MADLSPYARGRARVLYIYARARKSSPPRAPRAVKREKREKRETDRAVPVIAMRSSNDLEVITTITSRSLLALVTI